MYDLEDDLGEANDVLGDKPEVLAKMQGLAEAMRERLGDNFQKVKGTERREAGRLSGGALTSCQRKSPVRALL
ncbi:MAG: hypothetical protein O3A87_12280 [Verrucomicrobia bacterium]|nr:hypothetical protein [Verrucomicrobiota bacterium]MDA1007240.1 hypothetical protein [Verrucomicrobiota bacterium]